MSGGRSLRRRASGLVLTGLCLVGPVAISTPAWSQANFPFNDVQQLTPDDLKVQKYKLQRLRITQIREQWFIIRGINERVADLTLLELVGETQILEDRDQQQLIGNSVAIGGLALMAVGGLMLGDLLKFPNSGLVGVGAIITGGALAVGSEIWIGNIGDETGHLITLQQAEAHVKTYNDKLKKELGVENVPNLD
ncbi:MAG: hypothetical protein ACO1RX_22900 [Candidatus Sericytochromatia bacterium]